jgi:hypothetical protein
MEQDHDGTWPGLAGVPTACVLRAPGGGVWAPRRHVHPRLWRAALRGRCRRLGVLMGVWGRLKYVSCALCKGSELMFGQSILDPSLRRQGATHAGERGVSGAGVCRGVRPAVCVNRFVLALCKMATTRSGCNIWLCVRDSFHQMDITVMNVAWLACGCLLRNNLICIWSHELSRLLKSVGQEPPC